MNGAGNGEATTDNAWLASMYSDAALEAVDKAIAQIPTIEASAAAELRLVLESSLEPALAIVISTMSAPEIALQPIVHLEGGSVIGYEALARFGGGTATADAFRSAAARGMHVEIELLALTAALARLDEIPPGAFLGVNISADALLDHRVTDALFGVQTGRLVVELTQQSEIAEVVDLKQSFRDLQASGATICVDGAGIGFFTDWRLLELEPEIIKIARPIIDRCDVDETVAHQVRDLVALGRRIGALSIAIGVERTEQRDVLQRMGVDAVQGHLFGAPSMEFQAAIDPRLLAAL